MFDKDLDFFTCTLLLKFIMYLFPTILYSLKLVQNKKKETTFLSK